MSLHLTRDQISKRKYLKFVIACAFALVFLITMIGSSILASYLIMQREILRFSIENKLKSSITKFLMQKKMATINLSKTNSARKMAISTLFRD